MSQRDIDAVLLAYVAAFLVYKAITVRKETPLGWSIAAENVALSAVFVYSVAVRAWPAIAAEGWLRTSLRVVVALAVTWAAVMLTRENVGGRDRRAGVEACEES